MQQSRITEEEQGSSISLHQNTLIQVYGNLDYSDEQPNDSSSQDRSLSRSRQQELAQITQLHQIRHQRPRQHQRAPTHNRHLSYRPSRRQYSDLESKNQLGISPSTKQQNSILKAYEQLQARNFAIRVQESLEELDPRQRKDEQIEISHPIKKYFADESDQESIDSGRQAKLGVMPQKRKNFDIDSWLNPQPQAPKNKKGVKVLTTKYNQFTKEKTMREKPKENVSSAIQEEESITLITFPEREAVNCDKYRTALKKGECQLQTMKQGWQRRFNEARLNFMDSFLPVGLKIKNSPYNLLKHINNRVRI